jgi:hypothetical protein
LLNKQIKINANIKLFALIAKAKIEKYTIIKISSFFLSIIIKKIKINKN